MNEFTFEYEGNDSIYETYEWDRMWIEQTNDDKARRVLYIGDSISEEPRKLLTPMCGDKILFDGFATSKGADNPYFKETLNLVMNQLPKIDLVFFSNGLHGWHLDDEKFAFYYEELVQFLLKKYEKNSIYIFLLTYLECSSFKDRIIPRNEVIEKIAKKYDLSIVDLYSVVKQNKELISGDGVHLLAEGTELIAKKIIEVLKEKELL